MAHDTHRGTDVSRGTDRSRVTDLRRYTRQTTFRLVIGFILILFIVGEGLIYLIYGPGAAITGLICLSGLVVPVLLIVGALYLMEWVVKRADRE